MDPMGYVMIMWCPEIHGGMSRNVSIPPAAGYVYVCGVCFGFFFPPILFTISESNTSLEMHPRWWILVNCPFCTSVNGRPRALLLGNLPYLPDVLVLDVAFMDFKASLVWLVTQSHDIPIESRKNKRAYYQVPLWTMVKSRYKLLIILHGSPLINQYQQKYYGTSLNYGNYGYG